MPHPHGCSALRVDCQFLERVRRDCDNIAHRLSSRREGGRPDGRQSRSPRRRDRRVARRARLASRLSRASAGSTRFSTTSSPPRGARARGCRSPPTPPTSTRSRRRPSRAHPGDRKIEMQIRRFVRWNAAAIVLKANKESSELGGHIASFQSAATLYDTGFMHFWHAREREAWRRSRSISRATARPASTPAPFSKGA